MTNRKKILIVDYRPEGHRGYESFSSVEFHERYPTITSINPDEVATVFVHEGNTVEKRWTERHFLEPEYNQRLFFIFSAAWDDKPAPMQVGCGYKIGRERFLQYIPKFLAHYEVTGELRAEIFKGEEPPLRMSPPQSTESLLKVPRLIFADPQSRGEAPPENTRVVSIVTGNANTIEFLETLEALATLPSEPPLLFHIKETYVQDFDGLELAWHIRLAAFLGPFSRFPIYLQLTSDISVILKAQPRWAQLLFSVGVSLSPPTEDLQTLVLASQEHDAYLQNIAVPMPPRMTTHDLANEWGALRFLAGYEKLTGNGSSSISQRSRFLKREYYWLLLARAQFVPSGNLSGLQNSAANWSTFLNSLGSGLDILLIDDHADSGWSDAIKSIFKRTSALLPINLEWYPRNSRFDSRVAEDLAVNRSWKLIFCDLRLTDEDNHAGHLSAQGAPQLSGVQLISNIKRLRPDVPVIAFTASEKSWNYGSALDAGADACWIKEGPSAGINDDYTIHNVIELLNAISRVISKKQLSAKLWSSYHRIVTEIHSGTSLARWPALPTGTSNKPAQEHLTAIAERLRRAYGYLEAEPSDYYQKNFEHNPRDLAFLMVWSCINEVIGLYFAYDNSAPKDYYRLIQSSGAAWSWNKYAWPKSSSPCKTGFDPSFEALGKEDVALCRKKINFGKMYAPGNLGKIFGTEHIQLLLRAGNQAVLESSFINLRELRNYLELEHGDINTRKHATQQHINDMLDVIDYFI